MNGAESLLRTLVHGGVDVCFANPGTSEMQFVAAADRVTEMRCVLVLFEGVASGAADGYARMIDFPAATLFHLGPGLGNALANLHNAMRARVPMINIVGDHATYHRKFDAPLQSDIAAIAGPVSGWIRDVRTSMEMPEAAHEAIRAALGPPGRIATLITPADCTWDESTDPVTDPVVAKVPAAVTDSVIEECADALRSGRPTVLLMSGFALREKGLEHAGRISRACGARLFCDTFNTRLQRGAGRVPVERLPYFPDLAVETLRGTEHLIVVGTKAPVGFFAYPGVPGELAPPACKVHVLARPEHDAIDSLSRLADAVGAATVKPHGQGSGRPGLSTGKLTPDAMASAIALLLPEHAVVADESVSAGLSLMSMTAGAAPHDWLFVTGGAVGQGPPMATGAAIACPDRRVLNLQADGSALYTLQALWTQARESLNVTTVIYANREYRILKIEHERVGAGAPGPMANGLFTLDRPDLDWVQLSQGMGVPARRVETAEDFTRCLEAFLNEPGPNLIEAVI